MPEWMMPTRIVSAPDPETSDGIPRDRYGRPVLPLQEEDGQWLPVPFTRASTVAGTLGGSARGLMKWSERLLARGLAEMPDSCRYIASLYPEEIGDLDKIIETAKDRGGANDAARYGSTVHGYATPERVAAGKKPNTVDPHIDLMVSNSVDTYTEMLQQCGIHQLSQTEIFVANRQYRVAGSIDGLYRLPSGTVFDGEDVSGRVLVGDIKTGKHVKPIPWCVQLTAYAHGCRYTHDPKADPAARYTPIHPDLHTGYGLIFNTHNSRVPYTIKLSPALLALACTAHRGSTANGARKLGALFDFPTRM